MSGGAVCHEGAARTHWMDGTTEKHNPSIMLCPSMQPFQPRVCTYTHLERLLLEPVHLGELAQPLQHLRLQRRLWRHALLLHPGVLQHLCTWARTRGWEVCTVSSDVHWKNKRCACRLALPELPSNHTYALQYRIGEKNKSSQPIQHFACSAPQAFTPDCPPSYTLPKPACCLLTCHHFRTNRSCYPPTVRRSTPPPQFRCMGTHLCSSGPLGRVPQQRASPLPVSTPAHLFHCRPSLPFSASPPQPR